MKKIISVMLMSIATNVSMAAHEQTVYGKITGIESRSWGMHIQTDFAAGKSNGCEVTPGMTYMYDFQYANNNNGDSADDEIAMILTAFSAHSDISFHIYGCNSANNRPVVGYIRLRK